MAVVRADSARTIAFGSITGSYTSLGSALTHNWRVFCVTNDTDAAIWISFNASTNNLYIPAYSFRLYDLSTNAANVQDTDGFEMQLQTQFSIKYAVGAPTQGIVVAEGLYSR